MFVHPKLHLKKLSATLMPSGRELFNRYGLVSPQHDGNRDPYKFTDPVNPHLTQLESLSNTKRSVIVTGRALAFKENQESPDPEKAPAGDSDNKEKE